MVSEVRTMVTIIKESHWEGALGWGFWALTVICFYDFDASLTSTLIFVKIPQAVHL